MSKEFGIYIYPAEDTSIIEFELIKASTSEYWQYTATRYTGTGIDLAQYFITDNHGEYPTGTVTAEFDPEHGIVWTYDDRMGLVEGKACTFKKALLKLTKNALHADLRN